MSFVPNTERFQKLLLLYIAKEFLFPLTEDQFIKIILDNGFMSYIDYKQSINELIKTSQIKTEQRAGLEVYKITEDGIYTLEQFISFLPDSPREAFHQYVENNLHKIKNETLLDSSYRYLEDGQTEITCNIRENNSLLMSLKMYIGDEYTAKAICENWETASPMIYQILLDTLLR